MREVVVLFMAAALWYALVIPFRESVSDRYLLYLAGNILLVVQYFRVVIFGERVFWIRPFAVKIGFGVINVFLFIAAVRVFMYFIAQFEDYNFTGVGVQVPDILPGLSGADYRWLRSATFLTGVSGMMLIVFFQARLIYSIFKYRQIPGVGK